VGRVLRPAQHIIGDFGDESFQAITCTSTDNSKQMRKYTKNTKQTQRPHKHKTNTASKPKSANPSKPV